MNSFRSISGFTLALVLYVCVVSSLRAQTSATLDKKVVAANRELDQRLMDAHALKDAALVESLFSESPDVFFIEPTGDLTKGRSNTHRPLSASWSHSIRRPVDAASDATLGWRLTRRGHSQAYSCIVIISLLAHFCAG